MKSNPSPQVGRNLMVGSAYSITASSITLTLGAVRSILLARWIAPQHFGTLALALFFINLATHLRGIGLDMAVIHKQDADESFLGT
ncbi:MAG: oligosaccharide flippase family protein, partial [Anaerolineales bacterium]|nr:oligosaccharide flippase family protein [Anaerolineales bacterium]